jgi:hypothetical protein
MPSQSRHSFESKQVREEYRWNPNFCAETSVAFPDPLQVLLLRSFVVCLNYTHAIGGTCAAHSNIHPVLVSTIVVSMEWLYKPPPPTIYNTIYNLQYPSSPCCVDPSPVLQLILNVSLFLLNVEMWLLLADVCHRGNSKPRWITSRNHSFK